MRKKLKSSPRHTKQSALVFQKHWNYYIVVSEITYARNDSGKIFLQQLRMKRLGPRSTTHRKKVFL
jgi:transposase